MRSDLIIAGFGICAIGMLLSFIGSIFGSFFMIVGGVLLWIGILTPPKSTKVVIQSTDVDTEGSIKTKKVIEEQVIIKVKCPYCGALYDQTLDRCPYCGASR
jgi:hypothetical protein